MSGNSETQNGSSQAGKSETLIRLDCPQFGSRPTQCLWEGETQMATCGTWTEEPKLLPGCTPVKRAMNAALQRSHTVDRGNAAIRGHDDKTGSETSCGKIPAEVVCRGFGFCTQMNLQSRSAEGGQENGSSKRDDPDEMAYDLSCTRLPYSYGYRIIVQTQWLPEGLQNLALSGITALTPKHLACFQACASECGNCTVIAIASMVRKKPTAATAAVAAHLV